MKFLILLLTLTLTLFATNSMPKSIQDQLCQRLAYDDNRCENGSAIEYKTHHLMNNGKLLLFVYLNPLTSVHPYIPVSKIAVTVDPNGKWEIAQKPNIIEEEINAIYTDPYENLWLLAHWQIEGVYPMLYYSRDGVNWKATILPEKREIDCCFEALEEPHFGINDLTLTFNNMQTSNEAIEKSWFTTYNKAMSSYPQWQYIAIKTDEYISNEAEPQWDIKRGEASITFINKQTHKQVTLPVTPSFDEAKQHYSIQIGAFTYQESLQKVRNALNEISHDYEFISKEETVNGKPYYKLLIGEYTTQQKAQTILEKLKRRYQKNNTIQKAFVISFEN